MSDSTHPQGDHPHTIEIFDENFGSVIAPAPDPILTGRQVAELGHRRPPGDFFILMRGSEGGLRELAEDETVDVRETRIFWAIAGDRLFRLVIDDIQYDWPVAIVRADVLYRLAEADPQKVTLTLLRAEGPNQPINSGAQVDLSERGVEHFVSVERKHGLTIYIDDKSYQVEVDHLSGIQLKNLGGIEANYQLFLEQPGNDQPITDDLTVKLVEGARFYSLPPATFG